MAAQTYDMSDSYDMLDDVSEISNDDRETASLASTERDDGMLTPDDEELGESIVDVRAQQGTAFALEASHTEHQMRAENELLDSHLSEDLETPRQSTLRGRPLTPPSPSSPADLEGAHRVLFVSERDVTDKEISDVCLRIADCIGPKGQDLSNSICRMVRFPPTPSGISPSSALFLRAGEVELLIEHCVGAKRRTVSPISYGLRILDADEEHTSIFTVGQAKDCKIDLQTPELVVFYLNQPITDHYPSWFATVKNAMRAVNVPSILVGGLGFDFADDDEATSAFDNDIVVTRGEFFSEDDEGIRLALRKLVGTKTEATLPPTPSRKSVKSRSAKKNLHDLGWISQILFFVALIMLTSLITGYQFFPTKLDPATELSIRRDALSAALYKAVDPTLVDQLNTTELLTPSSPLGIGVLSASGDSIPRRDVFVGFSKAPNRQNFPEEKATRVYKSDSGQDIPFSLTKLIEGIYYITFSDDDAAGPVDLNMFVRNPLLNFTTTIAYRRKSFQWTNYEVASKELSRIFNKDLALASSNVKSIGNALGHWVRPKAAATKDLALQLAWDGARDLQIHAQTAVSVLGKASNNTTAALTKELAVVQKDLVKFSKQLQKSLQATALSAKALMPNKKSLTDALALSHQRAMSLKEVIEKSRKKVEKSRKKDDKISSATKEVSLRLQNFFQPMKKTKDTGTFTEIAHCAREKDYRACRRAQKVRNAVQKAEEEMKAFQQQTQDAMKKAQEEMKTFQKQAQAPEKARPFPDVDSVEQARRHTKKMMDEIKESAKKDISSPQKQRKKMKDDAKASKESKKAERATKKTEKEAKKAAKKAVKEAEKIRKDIQARYDREMQNVMMG